VSRSLGGEEGKALGLSAFVPYVSLTTFVPKMWMCGPSCRICAAGHRTGFFFCSFWKPPHAGEVLPNFSTYSVIFLVLQSRTCSRGL
jgi:hypothetical protein